MSEFLGRNGMTDHTSAEQYMVHFQHEFFWTNAALNDQNRDISRLSLERIDWIGQACSKVPYAVNSFFSRVTTASVGYVITTY